MTKPQKPTPMAVRLPVEANKVEVTAALANIAREAGFFSHNSPKNGSIGHMLFALATGRAMIINMERKKETPRDK